MESHIIDYYNEQPYSVNVIDKMNDELKKLQKKYDELHKIVNPPEELQSLIMQSMRTDYDLAKLLFYLYGDKFKCTSIKKNEWFFYDEEIEKWRLSDDGIELRYLLNTEIHFLFKQKSDYFVKKYEENIGNNEWFDESDFIFGMDFLKLYMKLKKPNFKKKIMKECKELFYEKDFILNNINDIENLSEYKKYDPYGIIFNGKPP
jgi:hypothetical protein